MLVSVEGAPMRSRFLLWFAFCGIPLLFAESFDAQHDRDLAGNPIDLRFRLEAGGSGDGFHLGERIPIALRFSSDSPDKYKLDGANYDRSGRLPTEEFFL